MRAFFCFLCVFFLTSSCDLIRSAEPRTETVSGEWTPDRFSAGDYVSPRNHFYTFDVNSEKAITLSLDLTKHGKYKLYNSLGELTEYSFSGQSHTDEMVLRADSYTLMICLSERYEIGTYTLSVTGIDSPLRKTQFREMNEKDGTWEKEGTGGNYHTPRNPLYSFKVDADNAYVDINVDYTNIDGSITLTDSLGQKIDNTFSGRRRHLLAKLNKGVYKVWFHTVDRDVAGAKYALSVVGDISELAKKEIIRREVTGKWSSLNQLIYYNFEVTENNSKVDISLKSPDTNARLYLYDGNGRQLDYTLSGPDRFLIYDVGKGNYRIRISNSNGVNNSYTLIVYGNFASLTGS